MTAKTSVTNHSFAGLQRDINKALTVDGLYGRRAVGRERLGTLLADALLPVKCHPVAGREWLSANKQKTDRRSDEGTD